MSQCCLFEECVLSVSRSFEPVNRDHSVLYSLSFWSLLPEPARLASSALLVGVAALSSILCLNCDWGENQPRSVVEEAHTHCQWSETGELDCSTDVLGEDASVPDGETLNHRLRRQSDPLVVDLDPGWAMPTSAEEPRWAELDERLDEAIEFDGAFTVAAVVRFDERPRGRAAVLSRWVPSGRGRAFELGMEWDGYPYFMVSSSGRSTGFGIVYADTPLVRSGEVLLSASFEPNRRLAIYANGILIGDNQAVVPEGMHQPPHAMRVGSRPGCGRSCRWDGAVGDFLFFDQSLDDDEQAQLAGEIGLNEPATLPWESPEVEVFDLDRLTEQVQAWYRELDTGQWPGAYRWKRSHERPQLYSSADIVWIRWIIGDLDELSEAERRGWIAYLQSFQNPRDGSYPPQRLHDPAHALAHVTFALNALGGSHRYPISFVEPLLQPGAVEPWLESLDWYWQWGGSCTLWGIGMTMLSTPTTPAAWSTSLFDWLDRELDRDLGAWRRDHPVRHPVDWIGGGFHIWTLYASQGRPIPEAERVIDLALSLQRPDGDFDRKFGCGVLDGVWALQAAGEQVPYRQRDVEEALRRSAQGLTDLVERDYFETGSHGMLSRIATLAILQKALPDELVSEEPWRSPWERAELFEIRVEESCR